MLEAAPYSVAQLTATYIVLGAGVLFGVAVTAWLFVGIGQAISQAMKAVSKDPEILAWFVGGTSIIGLFAVAAGASLVAALIIGGLVTAVLMIILVAFD